MIKLSNVTFCEAAVTGQICNKKLRNKLGRVAQVALGSNWVNIAFQNVTFCKAITGQICNKKSRNKLASLENTLVLNSAYPVTESPG